MTTARARSLHILVVADGGDSAQGIAGLLRRDGHVVATAHTLAAALPVVAAGAPLDVLICDLALSDRNGGEALGRLVSAAAGRGAGAAAADGKMVQEALELRHAAEELALRSQRLYEEANGLVERLRRLNERVPAPVGR